MVSLIAGLKMEEIVKWRGLKLQGPVYYNREYMAPQIRSMNNWFHLEAKSWSYDYP